MKGADAADTVSRFLADQLPQNEYARWTKADLFSAFRWALSWIAQARPTAFVISKTITLQPGSQQDLPKCCTQMTDAPGNQRIVSRRAARLVDRVRRRCPPELTGSQPYSVESYSYDANNPYTVYVYPPVPANAKNATFDITCSYMPSPNTLDDEVTMDDSLFAAVVDLMIYHIGTGENESPSLLKTAQMRYQSVLDQFRMSSQEDQEQRQLAEEGKVNVGG